MTVEVLPFARLPVANLPDWNSLTNDQRSALVRSVRYYFCPECECLAGDMAIEVYGIMREVIADTEIRVAKPADALPRKRGNSRSRRSDKENGK